MKKFAGIFALFLFIGLSCTANERAKNFGGTQTIHVKGKLEGATWKEDHLWILTRPYRSDEVKETHEFHEKSSFGVLQGKVVIVEE